MKFLIEMIYEHEFLGTCFLVAVIVGIPTLLLGLIATGHVIVIILTMIAIGGFIFLIIIAPIIFIILVIKEKITRGKKV